MNPPLKIEKKIFLKAPRTRVWQATSDARQFGSWFGVTFDGPFAAGAPLTGRITPTTVDPDVAKLQAPHTGKPFRIVVDAIMPMSRFSFRWHPFAVDPAVDYSNEPMTLVTFDLVDAADGTLLTITETGFELLPPARQGPAFTANDGGWAHQTRLIEKYLAGP